MSLTLLGFTLCMLMPCWSACVGWGLLCLLLLLPWSLDPCSLQRFLPCKGFSERGERALKGEIHLRTLSWVWLWRCVLTWRVWVLSKLTARSLPGLFLRSSLWELSEVCVLTTAFFFFFTVFTFWCFDSRDLLLLGVYSSQHWAIFRESVNKSTQSPPRTTAFIRLSYADLLVLCSDPSTEAGDEGRPSSRAWHHFVNQSALGLLGSASSYPLQEA